MPAPARFRLRRRLTGSPGAPESLLSAEMAINFVDGTIYLGVGDDGSGNATSVQPVCALGYTPARLLPAGGTTGQALVKTSNSDYAVAWATVSSGGTTYTAGSGISIVDTTISADSTIARLANPSFTGSPTTTTPATLAEDSTRIANTEWVQDVVGAAVTGLAPLASPAFTGNPTATTQSAGNNTTRLATTAFVQAAISALVASAPGALDTLNELAAALGNDPNFATSMTNALASKQASDATLTALAGLSTSANQMIYSTGADAFSMTALTAFARTLLDDTSAAAMRTTLDLDVLDGGTF